MTGRGAGRTVRIAMQQVHATCVDWDGAGLLIRGPEGSGKSDLALRLIDAGARLVADDRCEVEAADGGLVARPPATIAGRLEVRGLGIVRLPGTAAETRVGAVIELSPAAEIERMPPAAEVEVAGVKLPLYHLNPQAVSAVARLKLILEHVRGGLELER